MGGDDTFRRRRRWFQFTLRTLLVMVFGVAILLAWFATRLHQARQQREALATARRAGAVAFYEQEVRWRAGRYEDATQEAPAKARGPGRLRRTLGRDFFDRVVCITFPAHASDGMLALLAGLPEMRSVSLAGTSVTDKGMAELGRLAKLEELSLDGTGITDAGVLRLAGLQDLKSLYLGGTGITDEGAKVIAGLRELRIVCLEETQVSDSGLTLLARLPQLEELHVFKTGVSEEGARVFEAARPSVKLIRTRKCKLHRFSRGMSVAADS